MTQSELIIHDLESYINPQKREFLPRFFKTGKGEYGEGDRFLGIVVPHIRLVAKKHKEASPKALDKLLQSVWHECRMCALLIMVEQFAKANETQRTAIHNFYLDHTNRINNWDLVDLTAPTLVGQYLLDKPRDELKKLAESDYLWEQRIAVVATLTFIRNGDYRDILMLAEQMLTHPHDLMHKATGWMLREMGKRDKTFLIAFLDKHCKQMPRTMLRYAIEKLTDEERRFYMKR